MNALSHHSPTPVILALTRRALICGLPYNLFICLLIGGCVAMVWIDSWTLVLGLFVAGYLLCRVQTTRDAWGIDIVILRLQKIGVCAFAIRKYFNARSYAGE
jgi:type IV secretory pathway VirB3-like protein